MIRGGSLPPPDLIVCSISRRARETVEFWPEVIQAVTGTDKPCPLVLVDVWRENPERVHWSIEGEDLSSYQRIRGRLSDDQDNAYSSTQSVLHKKKKTDFAAYEAELEQACDDLARVRWSVLTELAGHLNTKTGKGESVIIMPKISLNRQNQSVSSSAGTTEPTAAHTSSSSRAADTTLSCPVPRAPATQPFTGLLRASRRVTLRSAGIQSHGNGLSSRQSPDTDARGPGTRKHSRPICRSTPRPAQLRCRAYSGNSPTPR